MVTTLPFFVLKDAAPRYLLSFALLGLRFERVYTAVEHLTRLKLVRRLFLSFFYNLAFLASGLRL